MNALQEEEVARVWPSLYTMLLGSLQRTELCLHVAAALNAETAGAPRLVGCAVPREVGGCRLWLSAGPRLPFLVAMSAQTLQAI